MTIDRWRVIVICFGVAVGCSGEGGLGDSQPGEMRLDLAPGLDDAVVADSRPADGLAADLVGGPCDPMFFKSSCVGDRLLSCLANQIVLTDCTASGAICRFDAQLNDHGCFPASECTKSFDCTAPPALPVCIDPLTSKHYTPSCDAGECNYTLEVQSCISTNKPYCQGYTLWAPSEGKCDKGWCIGGGYSGETCFGGCSAGACLAASGLSWSKVPFTPGGGGFNPVTALYARGPSDLLLAVLGFSLWHYNGMSFTNLQTGSYYGIYATGAHIFAVGGGGLFQHYDGASWSTLPAVTTQPFAAVSGAGPTAVWAVGNKGAIARFDGSNLALQGSGTTLDLTGVYALSSTSAFAVGVGGTILYYDGTQWSPRASGTNKAFYDVWAANAANAFVVGPGGIFRSSGSSWLQQTIPAPAVTFRSVWGSSASDVFAVGDGGWIVHYDGSKWTAQDSKTATSLVRVSGVGPKEVYVGGVSQTLLVGK